MQSELQCETPLFPYGFFFNFTKIFEFSIPYLVGLWGPYKIFGSILAILVSVGGWVIVDIVNKQLINLLGLFFKPYDYAHIFWSNPSLTAIQTAILLGFCALAIVATILAIRQIHFYSKNEYWSYR